MADKPTLAMAGPAETLEVFARIIWLLEMMNQSLAHVMLAAALNAEQQRHLQFALQTSTDLRQLFVNEHARQGGQPTPRTGS